MEDELNSFIKVWTLAIACLCYCYYISTRVPHGVPRLLSLLPIFYLFLTLPLELNTMHLCGPTAFFLAWLATFKLLLFSFGKPPLSPPPPTILQFIFLACLPIKLKEGPGPGPSDQTRGRPNWALLSIKVIILFAIVRSYEYRHLMHPYVILCLYCIHLYIELEILLAICATPARTLLGFELEAQFDEPYLATSLQDFWGRRWNLMVTNILRPTVYGPIKNWAEYLIGSYWASLPAILATFLVSGLMHELIYFYALRVDPTWEVTWFFVLHGAAVAVEVAVKRAAAGRWRLHRFVSGPLVLLFTAATGNWLFFPQLTRNHLDDKVIGEFTSCVHFYNEDIENSATDKLGLKFHLFGHFVVLVVRMNLWCTIGNFGFFKM